VNVAAVLAVAAGVAVFYSVPHEWVKVLWGVGVAGGLYLALVRAHVWAESRLQAPSSA
jgi:phage shock protein PspC (stress-responsive transcriptional regulator)